MALRVAFERELRALQNDVLVLGSMVDKAIGQSIEALQGLDAAKAQAVIQGDLAINQKRFAIEEAAIDLIATQQPIARDLRTIIAILNIVVDLERMGDHAEGIAKIVLLHGDRPLLKPLVDIPAMAEKAREMLRRSLDALIARDAASARRIAAEDDVVDALYDTVYGDLIQIMIANPRSTDRATWLLWAAHNLERIADRTTNICERVVYLVTGRMEETNTSKY
ncbi:MAG: phosphate signaling complex protein PhoU [Chloroflexi bacterium]|nr:phosphate signaling complex protein PhoU [Chloroflexota bacterium]